MYIGVFGFYLVSPYIIYAQLIQNLAILVFNMSPQAPFDILWLLGP